MREIRATDRPTERPGDLPFYAIIMANVNLITSGGTGTEEIFSMTWKRAKRSGRISSTRSRGQGCALTYHKFTTVAACLKLFGYPSVG